MMASNGISCYRVSGQEDKQGVCEGRFSLTAADNGYDDDGGGGD